MMAKVMDPVPDASADQPTDGSRLKTIYLVGADGSRQPQSTWWDSERKEECFFYSFSDGSSRCVPSDGGAVGGMFTDASCSTPLFVSVLSQCPSAKYGLSGAVTMSCGTVAYESISALTPITPTSIFTGTPAKCTDASTSLPTLMAAYAFYTGKQVALSSFVSATKQHG